MRSRYGRYEVLSKLGQGAMAQVFLARDPVLSRLVAVKVLHADLAERKDVLQRFFNEARTVALVRNPHVVEVFDFGREGNDLFLVMEFVDGLSLQGLLRLQPAGGGHAPGSGPGSSPGYPAGSAAGPGHGEVFAPLDATLSAALMCHAAEGLSISARHGVVHRDIKPENLMINRQGYLKISDFGIAHVQDDSLTKTGAVLGSPLFMSPEQARGLKPITSQADMFSLGAVFYCCLAGRPPFRGRNVAELIRKIAAQPHTPLWKLRPDLDPALASLVETLMRKDPSHRGGGPRWLHRCLKEYLAARGEPDPAELIAAHVRGAAGPAGQSTWRMDAPDWEGAAAPATEAFARERVRPKAARKSARVLAGLGLAAAGGLIGLAGTVGLGVFPAAVADPAGVLEGSSGGMPGGRWAGAAFPDVPSGDPEPEGLSESSRRGVLFPGLEQEPSIPPQGEFPVADGITLREESIPAPIRVPAVVSLRSSPPFAEVFVDGRYMGVTPLRVELDAEEIHRVVLKAKDVPDLDTLLSLGPGSHDLKLRLEFDALARLEAGSDSGE